jgi:hypothetical protein
MCCLFLCLFFLKQELNAPLLLAFTSIVALKLLLSLSIDSSPLAFTLSPHSQTTHCLLNLLELNIIHPRTYFSNIAFPLNLLVFDLNQVVYGLAKLSILF